MKWPEVTVRTDSGCPAKGIAPLVISASRATDVPAFYADWLAERIRRGYVKWVNPFNGAPQYVSFAKARLFVFWSKNPEPMEPYLPFFDKKRIGYYFQFTLNDYEKDGWEPGLPSLLRRIDTFRRLSERVGKEKVIWRFDPLVLSDRLGTDDLLERIGRVGDRLKGYTEKLVFSFVDLYPKTVRSLNRHGVAYRAFSESDKQVFCRGLQELNRRWQLQLATCAETADWQKYSVFPNRCIDPALIVRLFSHDRVLMEWLGYGGSGASSLFPSGTAILPDFSDPAASPPPGSLFPDFSPCVVPAMRKDAGQRKNCGCLPAKDIGRYDTCLHGCIYCYANSSAEKVQRNRQKQEAHPFSDRIAGD